MAVVSQVRFGDGDWVTFDSTLPLQPADLPQRLLLTLLILSAAVILVSLIAVRWVTRPLHLLASAAENLGRDIRRPPLNEDGPSEVSQAARAFNRMQASLQRYLDDRLRVLAAISHDLKTPITRMRLRAEMLDDEDARARFEKDLSEMESMVGEALEFLRGEGGTEDSRPVDITGAGVRAFLPHRGLAQPGYRRDRPGTGHRPQHRSCPRRRSGAAQPPHGRAGGRAHPAPALRGARSRLNAFPRPGSRSRAGKRPGRGSPSSRGGSECAVVPRSGSGCRSRSGTGCQ